MPHALFDSASFTHWLWLNKAVGYRYRLPLGFDSVAVQSIIDEDCGWLLLRRDVVRDNSNHLIWAAAFANWRYWLQQPARTMASNAGKTSRSAMTSLARGVGNTARWGFVDRAW